MQYKSLIEYLPEYYKDVEEVNKIQSMFGDKMREISNELEVIMNQLFVSTATRGLDTWEKVFGLQTDKSQEYEKRREIVKARIRGFGTTTKIMLMNTAIAFSGGEVEIIENQDAYQFIIKFVGVKGIPKNMSSLIDTIEEIKPAHLAYSFEYTYASWKNVKGLTWKETKKKTWKEIKIYEGVK